MGDEDVLSPLCLIAVKSGAQGGQLLFKFPFLQTVEAGGEEEVKRNNPYALRISEDILNQRVNVDPTNIKDNMLVGLTDEILANMFGVSRELCGSKFELKVNDVRFVGHPVSLEPGIDEDGQWKSPLTMIHIVFALKAVANYSIVQCYHELSQRIGLILKHEERRVGYLNYQTRCLLQAQDEVSSLPEDQQEHPFSLGVERSQLAKDMKTIYESLCSTGEVRLYMNKWIELSFCLPQKLHKTHFPTILVEPESIFECLEALRPYHTLMFLVPENDLMDCLSTDASPALRRLIRQSSPLKSFRTIAVDADLSLIQVFQLTGHLLYWGKATVIYPICESNVYVLSPHLPVPLPLHLKVKFEEKFSGENLLEKLATFSLPCRLQVSPPLSLAQPRIIETIIWLLKHHLIVQLHTYVTLAMTPDMEWNSRPVAVSEGPLPPSTPPLPAPAPRPATPSLDSALDNLNKLDLQQNGVVRLGGNSSMSDSAASSIQDSNQGLQQCPEGELPPTTTTSTPAAGECSAAPAVTEVGVGRVDSLASVTSGASEASQVQSEKTPQVNGEEKESKEAKVVVGEGVPSQELTAKELEKRREHLLGGFTPGERTVLATIPAFHNIQELERFIDLCKYFRGFHHLEEIMYHENMRRSSLLHIVDQFRDVLIKHEHEDPAISRYFRGMQQT